MLMAYCERLNTMYYNDCVPQRMSGYFDFIDKRRCQRDRFTKTQEIRAFFSKCQYSLPYDRLRHFMTRQ